MITPILLLAATMAMATPALSANVDSIRQAAEKGSADAQFVLGAMHFKGDGVPQDYAEAAKWFLLAGEQGDSGAQNNLGLMYSIGKGVPFDRVEALNWYLKAADLGSSAAQENACRMLGAGDGVAVDLVQAYMWCTLAAAQGQEHAEKILKKLTRLLAPGQIAEAQARANRWKAKGNQAVSP
ncbi:MAG: sel1 repeat family protein [Magnetococcales bacterium]|nr:sel1 repeat family protein [Magnetococcales bacterium]